jgi:hypothetical protein
MGCLRCTVHCTVRDSDDLEPQPNIAIRCFWPELFAKSSRLEGAAAPANFAGWPGVIRAY